MKKALALILSLLVAFSMFSVAVAAVEEETKTVTVTFVNGGVTEGTLVLAAGTAIYAEDVPGVETEYYTEEVVNGEKKEYKHTFKGWKSSVNGNLYFPGAMPNPTSDVTYTAEYSVEDYSERQSFWNFIESLFERLNILFEYFATIFNF